MDFSGCHPNVFTVFSIIIGVSLFFPTIISAPERTPEFVWCTV